MKHSIYPRLAWSGIQKNKQLYIPYILTCAGMIMMYYIVTFLTCSEILNTLPGGADMQYVLNTGCAVIAVFATIFLFYTNSFLSKRRKKEFGLYNVLGMGKGNLSRVVMFESLIIAVISLIGGLFVGIALSKLAELGMINILRAKVNFTLRIEDTAIVATLKLFAIIFAVLMLYNMLQILFVKPVELMRSEHTGEKAPKANWLLALGGVILLGAAYYLAVSIENPVVALSLFFIAVIMVIIATYMLFVAGSVTLCRILQKKKSYYYKTNHFVSVSSMAYRMKRNGSGLASVCILCTIVLVMLSSTVCLYLGAEDALRTRYPRHIDLETRVTNVSALYGESADAIRNLANQVVAENNQEMRNLLDYRAALGVGFLQDGDVSIVTSLGDANMNNICQIFIVPLEDYNRLMQEQETLEEGEVLIYVTKTTYEQDTVTFENGLSYKVKRVVPDFVDNGTDAMQVFPSLYIIVPDLSVYEEALFSMKNQYGDDVWGLTWYYCFDLDCGDEEKIQIQDQIVMGSNAILSAEETGIERFWCEGVAKGRATFYGLYGGLFFVGILLGLVFVFAAVLMIYYKQVSEGYEDQSRFEIMQKVGMSKKEIRKSINSQILTVFFAPLILAGIHLCFAFPLVYRLLTLFSVTNLGLLIVITVSCFLVFAVFYVLVYRATSKAYYSIVSGAR